METPGTQEAEAVALSPKAAACSHGFPNGEQKFAGTNDALPSTTPPTPRKRRAAYPQRPVAHHGGSISPLACVRQPPPSISQPRSWPATRAPDGEQSRSKAGPFPLRSKASGDHPATAVSLPHHSTRALSRPSSCGPVPAMKAETGGRPDREIQGSGSAGRSASPASPRRLYAREAALLFCF